MATPGPLALLTEVFGATMALYGGGRLTRLTQAATPGDLTLTLERTAGLPVPGAVSVGRVTYAYTGVQGLQLTGVAAQQGGTTTPGVVAEHPALAQVLDVSGTYSELDALYAAMFVPTASGEDLAVLARNLGVSRFESLRSDDQLRALIHAIAYVPRGTSAALTGALDAILGAGKYAITTDPFAAPATVTVTASHANFAATSPIGASYLTPATPRTPAADGSFALPAPFYGHGRLTLAELQRSADCRAQLPSGCAPAGFWARQGDSEASACAVVAEGPGATSSQAQLTGSYQAALPRCPAATYTLAATLAVGAPQGLATQPGRGCAGLLDSGARQAAWDLYATPLGTALALVDAAGNLLSSPVVLPGGVHAIALRLSPAGAQLRLDGLVVGACPAAALPAGKGGQAAVGNLDGTQHPGSGGAPPCLRLRHLDVVQSDPLDYGNLRTAAALSAPNVAALPAARAGQQVWVTDSRARNPQGGSNSGHYIVLQASGGSATLAGEVASGGAVSQSGGVSTFTAPAGRPLRFPDDLGKQLVLSGGGAGVDGTYTVAALLDPASGRDLASYATRLPAWSSQAVLSGGAPLAASALTWQLNPAFVAEAKAAVQLAVAATLAPQPDGGRVLTPPAPLPAPALPYILPADDVLGGTLQDSHAVTNKQVSAGPPPTFARYPFYLSDPFDALEAYLSDLVAAGVSASIRYR